MHTIVIGSIAFDKIMMFPGKFGDHILPDKTHSINVAFHIPRIITEHGGTGANISYALAALGDTPVLVGAVGGLDGDLYMQRLSQAGIDISQVMIADNMYSAQANIMTDSVNNQITAFHPGAMPQSVYIELTKIIYNYEHSVDLSNITIIAPDDKDAMCKNCLLLAKTNTQFIFDPGQVLPLFSKEELLSILPHAYAVTVNDYEASLLTQITGLTIDDLSTLISNNGNGGLVITRGHAGVDFYRHNHELYHVDVTKVSHVVDPTGCGDAFRAGLLYVLARQRNWELALCVGSCLGGLQVQHRGAQNHDISLDKVISLGIASYGSRFADELFELNNEFKCEFSN